jgi:hypothetical protein
VLLRPAPEFLALAPEELTWLRGSLLEPYWDNGLENNETHRQETVRRLIDKMEVEKLTHEEEDEIKARIHADPFLLHSIEIQNRDYWAMI